jgi:hypothetical protein
MQHHSLVLGSFCGVQLLGMSLQEIARATVSKFLFRHPSILFRGLRFGSQAASAADMRVFINLTKRAEWASIISELLPLFALEFTASEPIRPSDITLARRIMAAYRLSKTADPDFQLVEPGSTWSILQDLNYARLLSLLHSGDEASLASLFGQLFSTKTVDGYTMATWFDSRPHRWWIWGAAIVANIASLAEYSGLFSVECAEQGLPGAIFRHGADAIFEKLEEYLGVRIEAPQIGAPRGIRISGRFISRETCTQIYTACQIVAAIDQHLASRPVRILEIGAGYGGLCYWLRKLLDERLDNYTIIDLPSTNAVIAYYLANACGHDLVRLFGECDGRSPSGTVSISPATRLDDLAAGDFNVIINQDSMPELPPFEIQRYLEWIAAHTSGLFFSFNQETKHNGQLSVPDFTRSMPNLKRLSRHASWDRRGYVEEVYATGSNSVVE